MVFISTLSSGCLSRHVDLGMLENHWLSRDPMQPSLLEPDSAESNSLSTANRTHFPLTGFLEPFFQSWQSSAAWSRQKPTTRAPYLINIMHLLSGVFRVFHYDPVKTSSIYSHDLKVLSQHH